MIRFTTVNGVQLNDYFSAGFGLGLHYNYDQGEYAVTLPVFLDLRGIILGIKKISPVIFFDIGPSIKIDNADDMDGIILEPGIGVHIPTSGIAANFSVSYMMQRVTIRNYYYPYYYGSQASENEGAWLKFISFKAGFTF